MRTRINRQVLIRRIDVALTFWLLLMCFGSNLAAQLKSVGKTWPVGELVPIGKIDHTQFDALLRKHVDQDGQVNYSDWKDSAVDRTALQNYLADLSRANTQLPASQETKLAYWINAYNAVTIEGILEVYPTTSIRDHTGTFGYNIWKDLKLIVGEDSINLNDIEHEVLRKMAEPRIHFAIVCASIGCPRLLNQAYVADRIDEQLTLNSRDFFSRKQNLTFDTRGRQLQLSAIMKWFATDFGSDREAQIQKVASWFPDEAKDFVTSSSFSISYLDYDWNLNERK